MALVPLNPETRNLIHGQLVEASNGGRFDNVSPSTEEVLGTTADGTKDDMEAAVCAARRAFDETGWSEDAALRERCLRQLHEGLLEEKEQLRSILVHEAGAPVTLTPWMHLDDPLGMLPYWIDLAGSYEFEQRMSDVPFMGTPQGRILRREPAGVVGAITAARYPDRVRSLITIASADGFHSQRAVEIDRWKGACRSALEGGDRGLLSDVVESVAFSPAWVEAHRAERAQRRAQITALLAGGFVF